MARTDYAYDVGGYGGSGQSVTPVQHDNVGYSSMFSIRGNPTGITRCDATVSSVSTCQGGITSSIKYNTAGSPISQTDPLGRVIRVGYADTFNSSGNPTTYAYPTVVTDQAGTTLGDSAHSSFITYRYDIGANVEAHSPTPNGAADGKNTERTYQEATGRIEMEKVLNNGAYTRYDYARSGNAMTTYSTIMHEGTGWPGTSDEVATLTEFDGAGRVRQTRTDDPDSSSVWTAKKVQYDILGRVTGETIPTLVDSSWAPTGDDYRDGLFRWNLKTYDWKGRVLRSIPSDSTGSDGKDTVFSYTGCGCAGGQVTTISGPQSDAIDMGGSSIVTGKRKTQKIIEDILGRVVTKEIRSLDGTSLYSTTTTEYNGRDQPTSITEHAVAGPSPTPPDQTTTMQYDGYGRLWKLHKPEWFGTSTSDPKYTTTTYNADDTPATVIDPRGASATYTYETAYGTLKRPLVTAITYATPNPNPSNVPATASVTIAYDPAGNRMSMSDGTGTLSYEYDELSRLTSERKTFSYTFENGLPNGYALTYEYFLNGGVKKITDPFGHVTSYAADKVGRMTDIGTGTGGVSTYVADIAYRSFGAVKSMSMSTTAVTSITMTYDDALRPLTYEAENSTTGNEVYIQKSGYTYLGDGTLKEISNSKENTHKFDQKNEYDFAGRLTKNDVGPPTGAHPFIQTMTYDTFSNLTGRSNSIWGTTVTYADSFTASYANNRKVDYNTWHDYAGNVIHTSSPGGESSGNRSYTDVKNWRYDAAGRMVYWDEDGPWGNQTRSEWTDYDGDGRAVRHEDAENSTTWYYVHSTVTGQKITDLVADGTFATTHVYMGGTPVAEHQIDDTIAFKATDAVSDSTTTMNPDGTTYPQYDSFHNETAGLGMSVPIAPLQTFPPLENYIEGGFVGHAESGCRIDGMEFGPDMCDRAFPMESRFAGGHIIVEMFRLRDNGDFWELRFAGFEEISFGDPAPLSADQRKQFDKSLRKIRDKLTNQKCRDFLESVFGPMITQAIVTTLETQHAYSGPDSININVVDAGLYEASDVTRMQALAKSNDPDKAQRFTNLLTQSVASWFKNRNGDFDGRTVGAVTSTTLPNTVFYRSFDWLKMVHESLHVISGLSDDELAAALGVNISRFGGDSDLSSDSINKKLKEKGCK